MSAHLFEGYIKLGAAADGGKKILYVKDSGRGMTEEQLSHITEPFYRTDKARDRRNGGTGLGLALCERIAKAHGAELVFSSVLGEGTVAKVEFSAFSTILFVLFCGRISFPTYEYTATKDMYCLASSKTDSTTIPVSSFTIHLRG